mmetsp:Transcript_36071/g.36757  ORF Transcript_36071/g.36757 Transcript_36071/m.36757 type:complete len:521 (+) Transcript_36071:72-1634(+)|eukprot:CAMPEP_0182434746 /NCGR_PEP_ID=MMETSP1167-20130531/71528_1 /TAXON_ID=2988 /ORGANISM="Mallomonas Sp, Strain CCMP3275" /LENGTH=520 /DNA_ID=CAMNT_0024624953 /DNA_START=72 /DNA_END=1634 /DNA_ORIENTATION=-
MSASISYLSSHEYFALTKSESYVTTENYLIISDDFSTFSALSMSSVVCQSLHSFSEVELEMLKAAAGRLNPRADTNSQIEFYSMKADKSLRRITLGVLPKKFSRTNCPARAHFVTQLVKDASNGCNMTVVIIPTEGEYAFAQAVAVSRCFPIYSGKSAKATPHLIEVVIHFPGNFSGDHSDFLKSVSSVAEGIRLCQELIDMPPNELHTDSYLDRIIEVKSSLGSGCSLNIIKGEACRDVGLMGLWSIGMASLHLPALAILSYVPEGCDATAPSICLVGKGIVYDTGGLSIKTGGSMPSMKRDMGGSAAILGAFAAIAKTHCSKRTPVHALLCLAENSVGPLSIRPDDIYTGYSGKTVEVNNTDAEGRLVLADGCAYAVKNLNPDYIIDMATLTGAQLFATGKRHAAIFCNDVELENMTVKAGKYTGDLTYPILYCPEVLKLAFTSQVADMKNSPSGNEARASTAGQFIANHIEGFLTQTPRGKEGKYLHIDMAFLVHVNERATGYGVALLYGLVSDIAV